MRRILSVAAVVLSSLTAIQAGASDRLWFGGGIGAGFGTVDYVEISPIIGYDATERFSFGGGITYRYRSDDRFPGGLSTNDYGVNAFARYSLWRGIFAHGEYEHLSYEFVQSGVKDRDDFRSVLLGPGFHRPLGKRTGLFVAALYNFSYDENDVFSPYDDEWVFRVGVSVGF